MSKKNKWLIAAGVAVLLISGVLINVFLDSPFRHLVKGRRHAGYMQMSSDMVLDEDASSWDSRDAAGGPAFGEGAPMMARSSEMGGNALASEAAPPRRGKAAGGKAPVIERKVIRNANLELEVKNHRDAHDKLAGIALKFRAEVLEDRSSLVEDNVYGTFVMKLEPGKLEAAVTQIEAVGRVKDKQISASDVTEEYVDLTSRLNNAKKVEKRLTDLMAFKTNKLADVLGVERELERVGEKIESIKGRIQFLDSLIDLSRITVNYREPAKESVQIMGGLWRPIRNALAAAVNGFVKMLAALIRLTGWLCAAIFYAAILAALVKLGFMVFLKAKNVYQSRLAGRHFGKKA